MEVVKLVVISDTHTKEQEISLPQADVLIHCGDFTGQGREAETLRALWWLKEQSEKFKHVIFIAGNHDFDMDEWVEAFVSKDLYPNLHYLHNSEVVIDGIKFYGSPCTPEFCGWAWMKPDSELAAVWNQIPEDTDVLITHGPPYSILDKNLEGQCCGSRTLYSRVKELKTLKHHFFGHIHEAYGSETIGNTEFHNCSSLNRMYMYTNPPMEIEI